MRRARPLRIVHFVSTLRVGGLERFAIDLANSQRAAGHVATVIALQGGPLTSEATVSGLPIRVLGRTKIGRVVRMLCYAGWLRPHVIHSHNPMPLHYAALAKLVSGARLVMTDHGQGGGSVRIPSWLEYQLTDAAVAVSHTTAQKVRFGRFRWTAVIHNGIYDRSPSAPATELKRTWGVADRFTGACIASLNPVKGHDVLLSAVSELRNRNVPVTVLIAGDGPRREALERQAAALNLDERWVRFLGIRSDIPDLLTAADFKVLTSRMEGLPLAILEAMHQGTPVVATAVGGVPEVIAHEQTGLLIAPESAAAAADAIERLFRDEALRQRLGAAGRALVREHFTFAAMCARYEQLYQRVLSRDAPIGRQAGAPPAEQTSSGRQSADGGNIRHPGAH